MPTGSLYFQQTHTSSKIGSAMRKSAVERRLRKIDKNEVAGLRLLERQEADLEVAIQENERLVEARMAKKSQAEVKLTGEVDKLTKKLAQLNIELEKIKQTREDSVRPLREQGEELREKLKLVKTQGETARFMRERSLSTSRLELSSSRCSSPVNSSLTPFLEVTSTPPQDIRSAPALQPKDPPPYSWE